jgi:hypothetical protein
MEVSKGLERPSRYADDNGDNVTVTGLIIFYSMV